MWNGEIVKVIILLVVFLIYCTSCFLYTQSDDDEERPDNGTETSISEHTMNFEIASPFDSAAGGPGRSEAADGITSAQIRDWLHLDSDELARELNLSNENVNLMPMIEFHLSAPSFLCPNIGVNIAFWGNSRTVSLAIFTGGAHDFVEDILLNEPKKPMFLSVMEGTRVVFANGESFLVGSSFETFRSIFGESDIGTIWHYDKNRLASRVSYYIDDIKFVFYFNDEYDFYEYNLYIYRPQEQRLINPSGREISEYHPIVHAELLLGGHDGAGWLQPIDIARYLQGGELYRLYSSEGFLGYGTGSSVDLGNNWSGPFAEFVYIDNVDIKDEYIAIGGYWDGLPRKPVQQSTTDPEYVEIVRNLLMDFGLENPIVNIVQNYRIDLDNDGLDEVVIYAEYSTEVDYRDDGFSLFTDDYSRFSVQKGSYSILLVRKEINGAVENIVLKHDIHTRLVQPDDDYFEIRHLFGIYGFYDLNGNGKMEIVTSSMHYRGRGFDVWEVMEDAVIRVMGNEWEA